MKAWLALAVLIAASPAFAAGNGLSGGGSNGGGGGGGPTQTATNGSDGQATNSANQQSNVWNYIFNGTTWDRMRGTGGAPNTAVTSSVPEGTTGDSAWTGTGTGSIIAILKALYGQAVPSGTASAPATGTAPVLTAQAPSLPMQHSTARSACITFTKAASTSALRTLSAEAASTSALYLQITDLAASPTSGANIGASLISPAIKVGTDGATVAAYLDFSGAPLQSTNGFTACLSSTDAPTYTATGAIGWFTAQIP